jgi:flavin-dependent dehydrogenase
MAEDAAPDLLGQMPASDPGSERDRFALVDGSRIAVLGGGPAGSFFAHFVGRLAHAIDLDVHVDIYESRSFAHEGPAGCNHCGGIVSESLVQLLALEGINLPPAVVQRGIDSYMLHTDIGNVRIETPVREKRIASVFRGNGPRESAASDATGLDRFLLELSCSGGANLVRKLVSGLRVREDRVEVLTPDGAAGRYDLVAVATGINSQLVRILGDVAPAYRPPGALRTFICEFDLGEDTVRRCLGDSMHVFLLDIPRLEFAALVPKGRFLTLCLLGEDVDHALVERFLATPEVSRCFPRSEVPRPVCHCFPRINTVPAVRPFADRMVWIGDSGVTRLYKDGIGSAYRTAKAAAKTAVFHGVAASDFERHFWPECQALVVDNRIARAIFGITTLIQRLRFVRRGVVRMTAAEQASPDADKPMSSVLWDVFTGSAPYREILMRTLRPSFPVSLAWNVIAGNAPGRKSVKDPSAATRFEESRRGTRDDA